MNYTALHIDTTAPEQRDLLIGRLSEKGFSGFEEKENELVAFITEEEFSQQQDCLDWLHQQQLTYHTEIIPDANWNAIWEKSFSPVQIGEFCSIRASFHQAIPGVVHDLIITPRMTFGTGHHSTTASMIRLMKELDLRQKRVLDFGTGTGILAILASKMGADEVLAIDNDWNAVSNARENALENNAEDVKFVFGDEPDTIPGNFDCILVNIQLHVILANLEAITDRLNSGGYLLLSGVLKSDYPALLKTVQKNFQLIKLLEENGWIAGVWAKK